MKKPITDKAEVGIDFPDKAYHGSFGRGSRYEAKADADGAHIRLTRVDGERRDVGFHLHYYLLADMLTDIAADLESQKQLDEPHRERLMEAASELRHALRKIR